MSVTKTPNGAPVVALTEVVKINNANPTDLKNACDDALKRYLSRPDLFSQDYTHTDVRLALGWLSILVAGLTGLYGWKVEFEESKPVVWAGVALYVLLTTVQTAYAYFVEGSTVFVGRRRGLQEGRIVKEALVVSARTAPASAATGHCPAYALSARLVRTASQGTTLVGRGDHAASAPYARFFDAHGAMDAPAFEAWLAELVAKVVAQ